MLLKSKFVQTTVRYRGQSEVLKSKPLKGYSVCICLTNRWFRQMLQHNKHEETSLHMLQSTIIIMESNKPKLNTLKHLKLNWNVWFQQKWHWKPNWKKLKLKTEEKHKIRVWSYPPGLVVHSCTSCTATVERHDWCEGWGGEGWNRFLPGNPLESSHLLLAPGHNRNPSYSEKRGANI